jgi:hypothetical protein
VAGFEKLGSFDHLPLFPVPHWFSRAAPPSGAQRLQLADLRLGGFQQQGHEPVVLESAKSLAAGCPGNQFRQNRGLLRQQSDREKARVFPIEKHPGQLPDLRHRILQQAQPALQTKRAWGEEVGGGPAAVENRLYAIEDAHPPQASPAYGSADVVDDELGPPGRVDPDYKDLERVGQFVGPDQEKRRPYLARRQRLRGEHGRALGRKNRDRVFTLTR